jgi:hypothetical protein
MQIVNPQGRCGACRTAGIGAADMQVEVAALVEALEPVVNRAAADAQYLGSFPWPGALNHKALQVFAILVTE